VDQLSSRSLGDTVEHQLSWLLSFANFGLAARGESLDGTNI
jgi:hypothetical protein